MEGGSKDKAEVIEKIAKAVRNIPMLQNINKKIKK